MTFQGSKPRYPKEEWLRREYWRMKGLDPDEMGELPTSPEYRPEGPSKELVAHVNRMRKRVEECADLDALERITWLSALDHLLSISTSASSNARKTLATLRKTAPPGLIEGTGTDASGKPTMRSVQDHANELMKERLARFKSETPPQPRAV